MPSYFLWCLLTAPFIENISKCPIEILFDHEERTAFDIMSFFSYLRTPSNYCKSLFCAPKNKDILDFRMRGDSFGPFWYVQVCPYFMKNGYAKQILMSFG